MIRNHPAYGSCKIISESEVMDVEKAKTIQVPGRTGSAEISLAGLVSPGQENTERRHSRMENVS